MSREIYQEDAGIPERLAELKGERDRARGLAAVLEAENTLLRVGLRRIAQGDVASERESATAYRDSGNRICQECWSVEIAGATLDRTDPMRAET